MPERQETENKKEKHIFTWSSARFRRLSFRILFWGSILWIVAAFLLSLLSSYRGGGWHSFWSSLYIFLVTTMPVIFYWLGRWIWGDFYIIRGIRYFRRAFLYNPPQTHHYPIFFLQRVWARFLDYVVFFFCALVDFAPSS